MRLNKAPLNKLKVKAGVETLVFMTDAVRAPDFNSIAASLPSGSIVILRDYNHPARFDMASKLKEICRLYSLVFLVAGDLELAEKVCADGVHLPEYMLFSHTICRRLSRFSYVTAACHNRKAINRAEMLGIDAVLISPVFETRSHIGEGGMGVHGLSRMLQKINVPSFALGGITLNNAGRLKGLRIQGVAAIDGIAALAKDK
jgi:thiamine-phosphate diphosphorylase